MSSGSPPLRRAAWLALVYGLLAIVLAACGTPDPQASRQVVPGAKPSGRILFVQNGDVFMWDGSDVKQVTHFGDAASPTWSSDGQRFVFVRVGDAYSDLYAGLVGGDQYQQLTRNRPAVQEGSKAFVDNAVWALDPDWAPSGDTIVYVSDQSTPKNYLWIIRGLGNPPHQIPASTVNGDNVEDPRFSPDGNQVVFTQRMTNQTDGQRFTELWIVNLQSGQLQALTKGEQGSYDASWSPDGKWIAYVQRNGKNNDLWAIPAAGGQPTKLTDGHQIASPVWSPDGSSIGFFEEDGTSFKVSYVTFSVGANGAPTASKPDKLFSANGTIDATSDMSWIK